MRKRVLLAIVAAISLLSVRVPAAAADPPQITVSASTTSQPHTVVARIQVCVDPDQSHCYRVYRLLRQGETVTVDSFLSLKTTPLPSIVGQLSAAADAKSVDYRLEFVSGVLPLASTAGSVPVTGD